MSLTPLIGFTIKFVGEMILAVSVYLVHGRVAKEMKIDKHIVMQINKEKYLALAALALIILGYFLELPSKISLG